MRWFFLLLVLLNAFYYVWRQQEAPIRPKEITAISQYKGAQQDIRLLSESAGGQSEAAPKVPSGKCIYLGGEISESRARTVEQRLTSLDIQTQFGKWPNDSGGIFWLKVKPESRRLMDDGLVGELKNDFPELKSKIMSCEGIATSG